MHKSLMSLACGVSVAACTSALPRSVELFVETSPPHASCVVSSGNEPIGRVDATPGIVLVPNAEADYVVSCRRDGYEDASAVAHAREETRHPFEYLGGKVIRSPGGASVGFALMPSYTPRL
jgi:hypothetical protein